ncbi:MAG: hypothetical protein ABSG77_00240 [Candidatus Acidiferrum sp.]
MSTKVHSLRFHYRFLEPMPPIFKRFIRLGRLEHTPSALAPVMLNPKGGHRSFI